MSTTGATPSRAQRLGALPYTRRHTRLLVGSGAGWALDAMDVGLISFVIVVLADQWDLTTGERSWIVTTGFVGMAIGATVGGWLADRFGRRAVFATTLLVYGLATGASALVSELSPTRIRGRLVVALESFWALGWILAAVIGFYVVPRGDDGWRWGLAIGLVPAVYALVVRLGLSESAVWLERRGRHEEAEQVVRGFELSAGVAPPPSTKGAPAAVEVAPPAAPGLWSRGLRRRTLGIWLVWFGVNFSYYGAFLWIPSLLVARGHDVTTSFGYTLVITLAQLPGYALAAVLVETWGRRSTLALFLLGSAVAAWFFGQSDSATSILVAGSALSFCNLGAWGALYAITPEIYPTAVRGSGAGAAAGFGRLASIAAPLVVPVLLERGGGDVLVFTIFTAAFVVAAAAAFLLPETRGRALDT